MRNDLKMLGYISLILLIFVLIGQGSWVYKYREIKLKEFRVSAKFVLVDVVQKYLSESYTDTKNHFKCAVLRDKKTFVWGDNKTMELSSVNQYYEVSRLVMYDHLYLNHYLDLERIRGYYIKELALRDLDLDVILVIRDSSGNSVLLSPSSGDLSDYRIETTPVHVGYECKHQIYAAFREPSAYKILMWNSVSGVVFVLAFVYCLFWQWRIIQSTWQNARVQFMGLVHLEHELRKPLSTMVSVLHRIVEQGQHEITEKELLKLRLVKLRLLKISEVIDTMLFAVKDSELVIARSLIDVRLEIDLIQEMFSILKPGVPIHVRIEEGVQHAMLDAVYFNILLTNLIDNAIKYGGEDPEVMVEFSEKDGSFVLKVSDNGIGMSPWVLKRIFKQFYRGNDSQRRNVSGFGLGLTFVDKVVKAYGGILTIESAPEQGSSFTVVFTKIDELKELR